jgi:hypothetical protein
MNVRNKRRIRSKIPLDQTTVLLVTIQFAIQVLLSLAMDGTTSQGHNEKRRPIEIFQNVVLYHEGESRERVDTRRHNERGTRDTCDVD